MDPTYCLINDTPGPLEFTPHAIFLLACALGTFHVTWRKVIMFRALRITESLCHSQLYLQSLFLSPMNLSVISSNACQTHLLLEPCHRLRPPILCLSCLVSRWWNHD